MKITSIEREDAEIVASNLLKRNVLKKKSSWLITGGSGFIGTQAINVLKALRNLGYEIDITIVDNGLRGGIRNWYFEDTNVLNFDVSKFWPEIAKHDFILHLATIASPVFYRENPLETLDANVNGTRYALEATKNWNSKLLIMSSSEIYGDPDEANIPTAEEYRGNVDCNGPRACYDESKRLSETLAWIYQNQFDVNVSVARPFNFFGPGMRLDDGRILPDLFKSILNNEDLVLHSDGTPTRTFCYIRDAIEALLLILLNAEKKDVYNVGNANGEISMKEAAWLTAEIASQYGWNRRVKFQESAEKDFLVNNPQRRAPITKRIEETFDWSAKVNLVEGLRRSISHFKELN